MAATQKDVDELRRIADTPIGQYNVVKKESRVNRNAKGYWWIDKGRGALDSWTLFDETGEVVANDEQYYPTAPYQEQMERIAETMNRMADLDA